MFLVPDGPIPLKGVINPCCIPPLHEPQYPVSVFTIGICFTKLLVKLLPKSGRSINTPITAKISTKINIAYSFNFGFQTKAASMPPHALIRKCVLSPVKMETMIEKNPTTPENKPALFVLLTAIAISTANTGNETLAIYPPGTRSP